MTSGQETERVNSYNPGAHTGPIDWETVTIQTIVMHTLTAQCDTALRERERETIQTVVMHTLTAQCDTALTVKVVITHCFLVVGDQRVPDGRHRQLDAWTRVKLVAVELRQNLVKIRSQLVASLPGYCTETHSCCLHSPCNSSIQWKKALGETQTLRAALRNPVSHQPTHDASHNTGTRPPLPHTHTASPYFGWYQITLPGDRGTYVCVCKHLVHSHYMTCNVYMLVIQSNISSNHLGPYAWHCLKLVWK